MLNTKKDILLLIWTEMNIITVIRIIIIIIIIVSSI